MNTKLETELLKVIESNGRLIHPILSNEIKIKGFSDEQIGNAMYVLYVCKYFEGDSSTNFTSKYPEFYITSITKDGRDRIKYLNERFWKTYPFYMSLTSLIISILALVLNLLLYK